MQVTNKIQQSLLSEDKIILEKTHYETYKRILDVSLTLLLLPLILPIILIISLIIKLDSKGKVFFAHVRIGKNGTAFKCYKFRTMVSNAEAVLKDVLKDEKAKEEWGKDFKLREDPRITRIGKFLRKSSLDELPQIFNVLQGNMSFVGPRPITSAEVAKYGNNFIYYKDVKPGITGLWQISGRNDIDYDKRVILDKQYSQSKSIREDIKIILKTIPVIFTKKGAY